MALNSCCIDGSASISTDTTVTQNTLFEIREGKDITYEMEFYDGDDELIPLSGVNKIYFTVRYGYKGSLVLQLDCPIDKNINRFYLPFTAENTSGLAGKRSCAKYKYDIEFEYTDGTKVPYVGGDFVVYPDVPTNIPTPV